ncbi:M1 family metallopeptidase [Ideonella azotifigens]|nr:M1 family metallopeptidase [Ideonella azotifigens]MCD2340359.1 M1 family metallopeptidase [Ideonella azotifigens]
MSRLLTGLAASSALVLGGLALTGCHPSAPPGATSAAATAAPAAASAALVPPSPDGIALASPHAAMVREPSAPGAWGGPRQPGAATLSDRVVDYRIQAKLDPEKHTIEAQQQMTWRNRSDREVRAVYLHLYMNGFEGQGSTFFSEQRNLGFGFRSEVDANEGQWGHIELKKVQQAGAAVPWYFVHPDNGPETDHTVVRLDLPQPVAPGASTQLDIDFFDQLPRVIARTGYFGSFHLVGQWFPKMAVLELPGERGATAPRWNAHEFHLHSEFYADFGQYDVAITVPKGVTVGAVGELQGAPVEKDGWVTHRYVQGDVHDFAFTADKRFDTPLEADWSGPGSPPVKVRVLFPPEYAHNAQPVLKATLDSLTYFSQTLGAYPYKTVTAVVPPYNAEEAGGMEYPTFFTAEGYKDLSPGTANAYGLDFVTIHEFGHGYFYGILASNEFEEPMLDEGMNEFWDMRMIQGRGQLNSLSSRGMQRLGVRLEAPTFEVERLFSVLGEPADGTGENSWDRLSSNSYGSVYGRSATAFHELETLIGSEALARSFKIYYDRWKFRHPAIGDLQAALIEGSGKPEVVNRIFEQQVYAAQKVDDRVSKLVSEEERPQPGTVQKDGRWVERTEGEIDEQLAQDRKAWDKAHPDAKPDAAGPLPFRTTVTLRRYGASAPQTLVVRFADGSSETVRWDDQRRWARYSWVKPAKALSAELDPQDEHALDTHRLDNSQVLKAEPAAARRWAYEIAALVQTFYALVSTL